jgi:hypothetical protein
MPNRDVANGIDKMSDIGVSLFERRCHLALRFPREI